MVNRGVPIEKFFDVAGYGFIGPYFQYKDMPRGPAIFLVTHYTVGGWHLIDVDHADDVPDTLHRNPKGPCWDRAASMGVLYAYIHLTDLPAFMREQIVGRIRKQYPGLPCG